MLIAFAVSVVADDTSRFELLLLELELLELELELLEPPPAPILFFSQAFFSFARFFPP